MRAIACDRSQGVVASIATSPLDLVKTRLQVQMANPALFQFDGAVGCAKEVLRTEGVLAFFDGVLARCMWLTPRYVIAVSSYEYHPWANISIAVAILNWLKFTYIFSEF